MPNLLLCIAPLQRRSKTTETVAPVDIFRAIWNYLETAEDEGLTARDGQKQTHIGRSSICQAFFRPGEGPSWALNPTGSLCQQSTFPREQDFQRPEAPSRGAHRPFSGREDQLYMNQSCSRQTGLLRSFRLASTVEHPKNVESADRQNPLYWDPLPLVLLQSREVTPSH